MDFQELRPVLSTYHGALRDPLWWPQERPVPMPVARGPLRIFSRRCRGLRPSVESVPEPEDSSPVLTCILGYCWSVPRGVTPRLEWGNARPLSSRAVASLSRFPSRGSRDHWVSQEAFPGGFPTRLSTRLSHVPLWCELILGLKVEAVHGKQVSLECTETSGGLRE